MQARRFAQSLNVSFVRTNKRSFNEAVIASATRTPVGTFLGSLSSIKGTQLSSITIKDALEKAKIDPNEVDEVILGNVLQANQGQAPARQALIGAGLPVKVPATTVNKVCASGMKSVMFAAQSVMLGHTKVVVAGGFESMSNAPFYVDAKLRKGNKMGDLKMVDSVLYDGLTDVYNKFHMGMCGENTAEVMGISREEQDEYAIRSYQRSAEASESGAFKNEIVPVEVPQRKGDPVVVSVDEEFTNINLDRLKTLRPAFKKDGTITAANASTLNDGATALVVTSADEANKRGIKPLARIISFSDAATNPVDFPIAPAFAIPIALERAGLKAEDIDFWEINEAFSVVALANIKKLSLDAEKVNVLGGGVSIGHPIGSSGARILTTLAHHLQATGKRYGCASICNGGGGASAIIIERL